VLTLLWVLQSNTGKSNADTARLEALLKRLDPAFKSECDISKCGITITKSAKKRRSAPTGSGGGPITFPVIEERPPDSTNDDRQMEFVEVQHSCDRSDV
jgi:hypothetical protein